MLKKCRSPQQNSLSDQGPHSAEYTLRDIHKPIGISAYELTRALPENLKSSLPTVEEIEAELAREKIPGRKRAAK